MKKILSIFLAGILSLGLVACGNDSAPTNTKKEDTKQEEKKDIKKEEKKGKTITVKEEGMVGNLGIKVLETKESNAISNESGKSTPSGKFIVLKLELKNNGEQATEYSGSDFKLKNDRIIYEVDDNSFQALGYLNTQETIYNKNKNFIGVYDKFNPGITKNTYIVFDIPKEVKIEDLKLVVKQDKNTEFNLK